MPRRILFTLVATMLATSLFAVSAMAQPPAENNGCSQGYQWMEVGVGDADRPTPRIVDDPANGGNGDGIVCARALGDGVFHTFPGRPDTIYKWMDNSRV